MWPSPLFADTAAPMLTSRPPSHQTNPRSFGARIEEARRLRLVGPQVVHEECRDADEEWEAEEQRAIVKAPKQPKTTTYEYETHQVVRKDYYDVQAGEWSKECPPRHRGADGAWVWTLPDKPNFVYGRAELAQRPGETVYIVEGEKCVEAARTAGLTAITWLGGANAAGRAHAQLIAACKGRDVVLLPDEETNGRTAMAGIATAMAGQATSVKVVDLYPDTEYKRDIVDWLYTGGTPEVLKRYVAETTEYDPPTAEAEPSAWDTFRAANRVDLARVIEEGVAPCEYLVEPVLLREKVHCIFGGPEQGKTMILLHLVLVTLRRGGKVLMFDDEVGQKGSAERLRDMGATNDELRRLDYFPFTLAGHSLADMSAIILEGVIRERFDLIALDSISKALVAAGLDENSNTDCTKFMSAWITPAAHVYGATVLVLDHVAKADADGSYGRGAGSKLADVDVQWHIKATIAPTRESMGSLVLTKKKDRWATVPAKVTYAAGGENGRIKVGLEASEQVALPQADERKRGTIATLYEVGPKKFNDWAREAGRTRSNGQPTTTFGDHARELKEVGHVAKSGDYWRVTPAGIAAYFPDEMEAAEGADETTPDHTGSTPDGVQRCGAKSTPVTPPPLQGGVIRCDADEDSRRFEKESNVPRPAPINTPEARSAQERVCAEIATVRRGKADGTRPLDGRLRHDARMAGYYDVPGETINGLIARVYPSSGITPDGATGVVSGVVPSDEQDDHELTKDPNGLFYEEAAAGD